MQWPELPAHISPEVIRSVFVVHYGGPPRPGLSNCKNSRMDCRAYIHPQLDMDWIGASIDTQILENPYSPSPLGIFGQWEKSRYWRTQSREGRHNFIILRQKLLKKSI